jgi:hypothetical protein
VTEPIHGRGNAEPWITDKEIPTVTVGITANLLEVTCFQPVPQIKSNQGGFPSKVGPRTQGQDKPDHP